MRILTWNCNGAFRKKYHHLNEYDSDIMIIQECENPAISDNQYREWASNYLWIGDNKNKGLGIFCKPNIKLELHNWENDNLKYFIPAKINDNYNLLAVWNHHANSPTFEYIGQLWKYLQLHKSKMNNMIVAGDFNSNKIWDLWDRWWNHSDVLNDFDSIGLRSLYHELFAENQGEESQPTFFLNKNLTKKYHIDYIFADRVLFDTIHNFQILNDEKWLLVSDHLPLVAEI